MTISHLVAGPKGDVGNSNGLEVATSVNQVIDLAEANKIDLDSRELKEVLVARNLLPHAIPVHNGLEATELVIPFEVTSSTNLDVDALGVVTFLGSVDNIQLATEIHITRSGGGANAIFAMWVEVSEDAGVTWVTSPEPSLRMESIDKDGATTIVSDFSISTPIPVGIKFRIVCTNLTNTILNIEPSSPPLVSSKGTSTGFSTKATFRIG